MHNNDYDDEAEGAFYPGLSTAKSAEIGRSLYYSPRGCASLALSAGAPWMRGSLRRDRKYPKLIRPDIVRRRNNAHQAYPAARFIPRIQEGACIERFFILDFIVMNEEVETPPARARARYVRRYGAFNRGTMRDAGKNNGTICVCFWNLRGLDVTIDRSG